MSESRADLLAELEAERDARHELLDRHSKMLVEDVAGQCLRYAAGAQLRVPPSSLPRVPHGNKDGLNRWERWRDAMRSIGYQVVDLDLSQIPPPDGQPWIAVVDAGFQHTRAWRPWLNRDRQQRAVPEHSPGGRPQCLPVQGRGMSELEANTGDEAPPPVTSTGLSASSPRSGLILGAGRLTVREICVLAAERSGATGISADGFWTSEGVS